MSKVSVVVRTKAKRKAKSKTPGGWIPPELRLPDSVAAIEAGRPGWQGELFQPDDTRQARVARLLGPVPGVTTADRLTGYATIGAGGVGV